MSIVINEDILLYVPSYYRCDTKDQLSMVQQLTWELSRKKMMISKNRIQLSKVVGQGIKSSMYECRQLYQCHNNINLHGS